jgi:hypothetical protein
MPRLQCYLLPLDRDPIDWTVQSITPAAKMEHFIVAVTTEADHGLLRAGGGGGGVMGEVWVWGRAF